MVGCSSKLSLSGNDSHSNLALTVGLITDIHYANKKERGTRFYRDGLVKVNDAVKHFNKVNPGFVVQLGDMIDSAETLEKEIVNLKTIEAVYAKVNCPRRYVLGNHCVSRLTKQEFYEHTGMSSGYDSFDVSGVHFITLDACHRSKDGVDYGRENFNWTDSFVPPKQVAWLKNDLNKTKFPVIIFTHQRIDNAGDKNHRVSNASQIRGVLEDSGKVAAVLQGHSHANHHVNVGGIDYVTLRASVEKSGIENKAYATLNFYKNGMIAIEGFGKQKTYDALGRDY